MTEFAQSPLVPALAWALTHFLWQGTAIGLLAVVLMRLAPRRADVRYALGVSALALMAAAPVFTLYVALSVSGDSASAVVSVVPDAPASPADDSSGALPRVAPSAPASAVAPIVIAAVWLSGVFCFSIRLLGGWFVARRLARASVQPAALHIQALATEVADRLGVRRLVAVLESTAVTVPMIIGWLRPIVVLPAAALSGLGPAHIEALIAHELAHVRRHDYLVNVLQSVVEVVLFYHPAVWAISRRVRRERELCCDDLAVSVCDRVVYATALSELAAMTSPGLVLAASGGDLLSRVRRILDPKETDMRPHSLWSPAIGVVMVAALLLPVVIVSARQAPPLRPAPEVTNAAFSGQSAPVGGGSRLTARGDVTAALARSDRGDSSLVVTAREVTLSVAGDRPEAAPQATQTEVAQREAEARARARRQEQEIVARQAEMEVLIREYERLKRLYEVGLISSMQLLDAEATIAAKKAAGDPEAARQVELDLLRRHLADARTRAEIGTASQSEVAEVEAQLARLQARGDQRLLAQTELKLAEQRLERRQALVEKGLLSPTELAAAERALAETRATLEQLRIAEVPRDERATPVDPARPIAAGDTLQVFISGEPDLPTTYVVRNDGTIRLPLLGGLKVAGQTAEQVRGAITRLLADRRLGAGSEVSVTIQRPARAPGR